MAARDRATVTTLTTSRRVYLGAVGSLTLVGTAHGKQLWLAIDHDPDQPIMPPGGSGDRGPLVGGRVVDVGVQPDYRVQLAIQRGADGLAGLRYRSPGCPGVGRRVVDIEMGAADIDSDWS